MGQQEAYTERILTVSRGIFRDVLPHLKAISLYLVSDVASFLSQAKISLKAT